MSKERIHIYPLNDARTHNVNSEHCPCRPSIDDQGESALIMHNAFDAREFFERDQRELEEEFRRIAIGADAPIVITGTTT